MKPTLTIATLALALLPSLFAKSPKLEPYANIQPQAIDESSGIVKSRQFKNVYWTHNDSGDTARIFPITRDGQGIQTDWAKENDKTYEGITIGEAVNIDWEDIAADDQGNLIIAACGNNANLRQDLAVYIIPEPNPNEVWKTRIRRRIDFHFPDQSPYFDPTNLNFDCESLFYANDKIYLVSKNRSNTLAKLYRLDETEPFVSNPLTLLGNFDLKGQATAADATPDGRQLAILTYSGCWVFIAPEDSDDYFAGQTFYKPFRAKQCEAICWDDENTLIITNEQGGLFELKLSDIPPTD
ncbi:hypothetical protein VDG1235_3703 [Verrucomicrobiia bacterium DG1235]|nr:hypothetical protein VDG1235_3703 [Verrucomicrobiae bacterium DG1235]